MTPGPLGLNCATFAGARTAGTAGALAASLGVAPEFVKTSWPTLMEDTLYGKFDLALCVDGGHLRRDLLGLICRGHSGCSQQKIIADINSMGSNTIDIMRGTGRGDRRANSIRTLTELYDAGDHEAVGRYLHQFIDSMPVSEVRYFCNDTALNALLNYYDHLSRQEQIGFSVQVLLPETLPVSDVDLCSMVGNILENAVTACRKADEKRKRSEYDQYLFHV